MNDMAPGRVLAYRATVFLIAILAAVGFGWMIRQSPRANLELKAEDAMARLAPRPARADMVILAIDDASVAKYGPVKSWPRALLALGLNRVESARPKAVVVDLAMPQRTHTGDDDLWRVIANNKNVVLGMAYNTGRSPVYTPDDIRSLTFLEKYVLANNMTFGPETQQFPYYYFEPPVSDFTGSSSGVGVFIRETDPDGILRDARLFYKSTVQYPPSTAPLRGKQPVSILADGVPVALPNLAIVSALRVFDLEKERVKVESGDTVSLIGNINPRVEAPVDDQGRMLIRYAGPASHYAAVSFQDVVSGKVKPDVFAGKTVILGATARGDAASDLRSTPFGPMYRTEVTANALATILDRSYAGRFSSKVLGIMILLGLFAGLGLMFTTGLRTTLAAILVAAAYLGVCFAFFAHGHMVLPILPGLLTIALTYITAIAMYLGAPRPIPVEIPASYVPPPPGAVQPLG